MDMFDLILLILLGAPVATLLFALFVIFFTEPWDPEKE